MHLSTYPDDPRPQQRARVKAEFDRAVTRLQGDQIPDYVILKSLIAICRKLHRQTEAAERGRGGGA